MSADHEDTSRKAEEFLREANRRFTVILPYDVFAYGEYFVPEYAVEEADRETLITVMDRFLEVFHNAVEAEINGTSPSPTLPVGLTAREVDVLTTGLIRHMNDGRTLAQSSLLEEMRGTPFFDTTKNAFFNGAIRAMKGIRELNEAFVKAGGQVRPAYLRFNKGNLPNDK